MPDWVDATVSPWIQSEVKLMNAAWGSTRRQHLVFTHIPPYVYSDYSLLLNGIVEKAG